MSFENDGNIDGEQTFDPTLIQLVSFERQRQRLLPDDHADKMKGVGRRYPIAETITIAQRRMAQIQKAISDREYIPFDEVDKQLVLDTYVNECIFGEVADTECVDQDQLVEFGGRGVTFEESNIAYRGVMCHVYSFTDTDAEDLAIIDVKPGYATPRQRVIDGERTTEAFIKGAGVLVIEATDGSTQEYAFDSERAADHPGVTVGIGQIMHWVAGDEGLVFAEVCRPPYQEGRFEDM